MDASRSTLTSLFCFIPYLHRTSSYPRYELAPLFLLRLRRASRVQFRLVLLSIHSCDHVLHVTATDTCRYLVALLPDHIFHVFKHENDSLNGSSSVFPRFSSRLPRPRVFSFTSLAAYHTHFRPERRCAQAPEPPTGTKPPRVSFSCQALTFFVLILLDLQISIEPSTNSHAPQLCRATPRFGSAPLRGRHVHCYRQRTEPTMARLDTVQFERVAT